MEWMANGICPWASLRTLLANRLVALAKCPGVRLVGIGEALRRMLAKCVLLMAKAETKQACGWD